YSSSVSVPSAAIRRRRRVVSSAEVSVVSLTGVAVSVVAVGASVSSSGGACFSLGASPVMRLLPLATISSMLRMVSSWRCPRRWRKRFLDLYRKTINFSPRACRTAVANTCAFSTKGVPIIDVLASEISSTSSNRTCAPSSTARRFTSSVWPTETLYCLPPLLMTANIVFPNSPYFVSTGHPGGYVGGVGGGLPSTVPYPGLYLHRRCKVHTIMIALWCVRLCQHMCGAYVL